MSDTKNNDFYYTEEELKTYCNPRFLKKVDNELLFKKKLTSEDKRELSDDQKKLRRSIMTSISQKRYALSNPDIAKKRVQNLKKKEPNRVIETIDPDKYSGTPDGKVWYLNKKKEPNSVDS